MRLLLTVLALVGLSVSASAQSEVRGLLQERAGDSFWTRVNLTVAVGAPVKISNYLGSETVATGRVAWVSAAPPHEVLISGVKVTKKYSDVYFYTSYERRFENKTRPANDLNEPLAQGMYVSITRSANAPQAFSGLVSEGLVRDFLSRAEGKKLADSAGARDLQSIASVLTARRDLKFSDPIVARVSTRIIDLDMSLNPKGGKVPGDFFPPDKAKEQNTGTQQQRNRTP
jgi:hypothetical protein